MELMLDKYFQKEVVKVRTRYMQILWRSIQRDAGGVNCERRNKT